VTAALFLLLHRRLLPAFFLPPTAGSARTGIRQRHCPANTGGCASNALQAQHPGHLL